MVLYRCGSALDVSVFLHCSISVRTQTPLLVRSSRLSPHKFRFLHVFVADVCFLLARVMVNCCLASHRRPEASYSPYDYVLSSFTCSCALIGRISEGQECGGVPAEWWCVMFCRLLPPFTVLLIECFIMTSCQRCFSLQRLLVIVFGWNGHLTWWTHPYNNAEHQYSKRRTQFLLWFGLCSRCTEFNKPKGKKSLAAWDWKWNSVTEKCCQGQVEITWTRSLNK